jgi:hypothetical protein
MKVSFSGNKHSIKTTFSNDTKTSSPSFQKTEKKGATFIPHIDENGYLSWTNDKNLENPAPIKVVGEDGVGIVQSIVEYAIGNSSYIAPNNSWDSNLPNAQPGDYLWTRITLIYSNGIKQPVYSVSYFGQSAYEIAKKNGFSGTEAEWLKTLKGKDGQQGATGATGLKGATGATGQQGNPGG